MRRDVPDELVARFLEAIDERWEARQPNLPGIVYHYTSIAAFRGIITSGCLWATTTSALNDTTELTHAQEILKQTLARHSAEARLPEFRVLYPPQLQTFDYLRPGKAQAFVASFSGTKDDLNQWCMYADRFAGVALGFDAPALRELDAARDLQQNVGFFAVSYGEAAKAEFFEWLVSFWEREAAAALSPGLARARNPFLYMASWFAILATCSLAVFPRMKDSRFASENEWRMTHMHVKGLEECGISTYGAMEHVELRLDQLAGRLPLRSVSLGPAIANEQSEHAVRAFLDRHGFWDVGINRSTLPLRVEPRIADLS